MEPEIDHFHLTNRLGYGSCSDNNDNANGTESCQLSLSLGITAWRTNHGHVATIDLHTKLGNATLRGGTNAQYDMNWLPFLQLSDILSKPACLTIPATEFDFYGLNAGVEVLEVTMDAELTAGATATSAGGGGGNSAEEGVPHVLSYRTKDTTELALVVTELLADGAGVLQETLRRFFVEMVEDASATCVSPANPRRTDGKSGHFHHHGNDGKEGGSSSGGGGIGVFVAVVVLVFFVAGNAWLLLRKSAKRGDFRILSLLPPPAEGEEGEGAADTSNHDGNDPQNPGDGDLGGDNAG